VISNEKGSSPNPAGNTIRYARPGKNYLSFLDAVLPELFKKERAADAARSHSSCIAVGVFS